MKKIALYTGALLTTLAFSACDEDFTDWANPQGYPQGDDAQAVQIQLSAVPTAAIDRETAADTVDLLRLDGITNAPEGSSVTCNKLYVEGTHALPFIVEDGVIRVVTAQLDSVVENVFLSRQRTERTLSLTVDAAVVTPAGDALAVTTAPVETGYLQVTPPATESVYYLLGINGWTVDDALAMTDKGNGVFEATFEVTGDTWFKILPQSAINGTAIDWGAVWGSNVDSDTSSDAFITWTGAQAFKVGAGKSKVTIDMTNWRYSIRPVSEELYLTGSAYGWGGENGVWKQLTPVHSHDGQFWTMIYLTEGEEFKFAPQAGWGGDFGAEALTIVDHANAGLGGTGNITVGKSGWYLLYVDATAKVLETFEPNVFLIGNCAGMWTIEPENIFTVPADKDGEFVSPTFVADGELRVCVHPKADVEWWQMEFIITDGKIDYRGAGPDQARVNAGAGQKLYLNFTDGTGHIK
ncbi:MAG: DUF5115 domain-containing protein [Alloprevotella sp.]